jgi:hypothetical protein
MTRRGITIPTPFLSHFSHNSLGFTQPRRVWRRPEIKHALEWMNLSVCHAELAIKVVDHGIHAPILGVFLGVEDRAVQRLPDAKHAAFTGSDHWPIAMHEFVGSFIAFAHHFSLPQPDQSSQSEPTPQAVRRG